MDNRVERRQKDKMSAIEKLILLLIPIPLLFLFTGTQAMIKAATLLEANAISTTLNAFSAHFEMHFLILIGALCLTLMLWFSTRKFWR